MPGAIAFVACANGKIHHFVCVKKDGSLGHIIASFNNDDDVTWSLGDLTGQAHKQSQIAIACSNPTDEVSSELDVLYQNPSMAIVAMRRNKSTGQWSHEGEPESHTILN